LESFDKAWEIELPDLQLSFWSGVTDTASLLLDACISLYQLVAGDIFGVLVPEF
jgi:hypothetical protein